MHGGGAHALAIPGMIATLEGWAADPSKIKAEDIKGVISGASGLLKPADESPNVPEEIAAFRKEFDDLLDKAGIEQLVVLIDDLDRCLPDTAIETLEAIRLFRKSPARMRLRASKDTLTRLTVGQLSIPRALRLEFPCVSPVC